MGERRTEKNGPMSPDVRASARVGARSLRPAAAVLLSYTVARRCPRRVQHHALLERLAVLLRWEGWCRGSSGAVTQLAVHEDARVHERVRGHVEHVLDVGGMFVVAEAEARVQQRPRRRSWRPSVDFAIFLREARQGSSAAVGGSSRDAGLPF